VSDIKSWKSTEESLRNKNYFTQTVGESAKAFYGRPNQDLIEF